MMRANRNTVWYFIDHVEFFNGDLVDFVENINGGNVHPVSFDDVDQIIKGAVFVQHNIRIVDLVFFQDRLDIYLVY